MEQRLSDHRYHERRSGGYDVDYGRSAANQERSSVGHEGYSANHGGSSVDHGYEEYESQERIEPPRWRTSGYAQGSSNIEHIYQHREQRNTEIKREVDSYAWEKDTFESRNSNKHRDEDRPSTSGQFHEVVDYRARNNNPSLEQDMRTRFPNNSILSGYPLKVKQESGYDEQLKNYKWGHETNEIRTGWKRKHRDDHDHRVESNNSGSRYGQIEGHHDNAYKENLHKDSILDNAEGEHKKRREDIREMLISAGNQFLENYRTTAGSSSLTGNNVQKLNCKISSSPMQNYNTSSTQQQSWHQEQQRQHQPQQPQEQQQQQGQRLQQQRQPQLQQQQSRQQQQLKLRSVVQPPAYIPSSRGIPSLAGQSLMQQDTSTGTPTVIPLPGKLRDGRQTVKTTTPQQLMSGSNSTQTRAWRSSTKASGTPDTDKRVETRAPHLMSNSFLPFQASQPVVERSKCVLFNRDQIPVQPAAVNTIKNMKNTFQPSLMQRKVIEPSESVLINGQQVPVQPAVASAIKNITANPSCSLKTQPEVIKNSQYEMINGIPVQPAVASAIKNITANASCPPQTPPKVVKNSQYELINGVPVQPAVASAIKSITANPSSPQQTPTDLCQSSKYVLVNGIPVQPAVASAIKDITANTS